MDKQATQQLNFLVSTLILKSNGFQNQDTSDGSFAPLQPSDHHAV